MIEEDEEIDFKPSNYNGRRKVNCFDFNRLAYSMKCYILDFLEFNDFLKIMTYSKSTQELLIKKLRFKGKTCKNTAIHYQKYFFLYNDFCKKYYYTKVFPLINNVDGLYTFLASSTYNNFLIMMNDNLTTEQKEYNLLFDNQKTINDWLYKCILNQIIYHLNQQYITELYFNEITLSEITLKILKDIILKSTSITHLDLSKSKLTFEEISSILKTLEKKYSQFTLMLKDTKLNSNNQQLIVSLHYQDNQKEIIYDPIYKGSIKQIENAYGHKNNKK